MSLDPAGQGRIETGDRDVDPQPVELLQLPEQLDVAQDDGRLCRDGELEAPDLKQLFEQGACHTVMMFGGLVGIGCRTKGDRLIRERRPTEPSPQRAGRSAFDEDFLFEVLPAMEIEEAVGVARVAVAAGELTAAVGVDGPDKGQAVVAWAIENLADVDLVKFNSSAAAQRLGVRIRSSRRRQGGQKGKLSVGRHGLSLEETSPGGSVIITRIR